MPTDLPIRRHAPALPCSTRSGNLFFACAVMAMLAISAFLIVVQPAGFAPG